MNKIDLIASPIDETEFVVLDFETTGLRANRDRVIEIGLVKLRGLKKVETFSSLINPQVPVPYSILQLTGIDPDELENAPLFEEIARDILDFIGDSVLVAHNSSFDISFLKSEMQRMGLEILPNPDVCTLKLSKKLLPDIGSKSLGNVAKHLRIMHKNIHRAIGDATVTAKVFIKLLERLKEENNLETVSDLLAFQGYPKAKRFVMVKKKLAEDLNSLPDKPGVYFFHNSKGEIIYIGKAKSLKNRVKNYFYFNASSKSKKIAKHASGISFETTNSELSALIAETELIKQHKPEFNVLQKRYPTSYFICSVLNSPAPYLKITTKFDFDGNDYFGAYPNRQTAKDLLDVANKAFGLRECSDNEFNKGKKCYLYNINRCLAPCEFDNIENEYEKELEKAYEFLSGNNRSALNILIEKMSRYSAEKKYEEAAEIRDTTNLLLSQIQKSSLIKGPINKASVLIHISELGYEDFLVLIKGKLFIKNFFLDAPSSFENSLEGFFNGDSEIFENLTQKDLERIRITLSWLIKNRFKTGIVNLADCSSKEEAFAKLQRTT